MRSDKSTFDVVKGRYGTLTVFANDTGAATQSVLTYGEWAENEIAFLQRLVCSGCTVLDIGAYIGTHTLAFARFVGPTGRVIAVEAQPDSFELLKKNIAENVAAGLPDIVELKNAIVSSEPGQVTIPTIDVQHEGSFGSASLAGSLTGGAHSAPALGGAQVPAITVDSLDLPDCALIKIDVEGVEHMVLGGAIQTLERCSPYVYCECNSLAAGLKSVAVLASADYKVFAHVVDAFNRDNYLQVKENVFASAREVALLGVPSARAANIRGLPVGPFELLLDIEDADDLALALLNKPQYPSEVLRQGRAAQTGGVQVLNRYDAGEIEVVRLQNENAALIRIRQEAEQQVQKVQEEAAASLAAFLKEKDAELSRLHAQLTERNAAITRFQSEASRRDREIAGLRALLTERDAAISSLGEQKQGNLAEIARLTAQATESDGEILRLKELTSMLHASTSWKVTRPLRWANQQLRRLRSE